MCLLVTLKRVDMRISASNMQMREPLSSGREKPPRLKRNRTALHLQGTKLNIYELIRLSIENRLESDPGIVIEQKPLFTDEIINYLEISRRKAGITRESKYAQLINACTGWKEFSTEARKAIEYHMLNNCYALKDVDL